MDPLVWSESYAVGVPRIDREHRELFRCVNSFLAACRDGDGGDRVEQTLHFLLHHAMTHFKGEEDQMEASGYPGLAAHREQHDVLLHNVREMAKGLHEAKALPVETFSTFMQDWVGRHVLEKDAAFAAWIKDSPKENSAIM